MNLRATFANWLLPPSTPGGWTMRGAAGPAPAVPVNEFSALALPVVYACVQRISSPLAMFPVDVFRDREFQPDHVVSRLLNRAPNPYMAPRTLRKTATAGALLWGNGYVEIQRDGAGRPVGLWPLLPWATHPDRREDRLTFRTNIDGRSFEIDHSDVLHVMDFSLDGYVGLSPIQQARAAVGLAQAAESFGSKFFANDAKSGGFLQIPGKISAKAGENIRRSMDEQGGLDNAHRIKVLEEGMKYVATTISPDDAQFLSTREFQIGEMARMYNVPLFLLQHSEPGTVWGSGMEQMHTAFVVHSLSPWTNVWEQEINRKMFSEDELDQGYFAKFNMDALLRGDSAGRAAYYNAGITAGWLTIPEAREMEDLDALPDSNTPGLAEQV
jgi:HK97 family phage portal protein